MSCKALSLSRVAAGAATLLMVSTLAMSAIAAPKAAPAAGPQPSAAAAPAAPQTNAPPSAGELAMKRGIDAYGKGNLALAVGALSTSIANGGLSGANLARALYFRGLAYRKQGKPAQAISDLTNAIWLKEGLTDAEQADATASRKAAYREAGIPEPGGVAVTSAEPATTTATTTEARPVNVQAPLPIAPAEPAAPAPQRTASATPPAAASAGYWQSANSPAAPAAQPAAPTASSTSGSSGGIGGFFNNLFGGLGGSSAAPASPPGDVTTASTGSSSAAVSSWSNATEVAPRQAGTTRTASIAPASPPQAASPASADAAGKYKLQVAILRSRAEADKLMEALLIRHASKLGQRATRVEEAVLGNMGTFYRVNVGPFADKTEPERLCGALRGDGYDCLVVTN
ncbi:MAG: SPOR domain-containing protein [Hyphomicrobiaceae bacterium]|nr:SPOR domain-containing protein [Hyphomicrobiaceae bacterium]